MTVEQERSEMHKDTARAPVSAPTRRWRSPAAPSFTNRSLAGAAAGAATYGWFPLINTLDVAYGAAGALQVCLDLRQSPLPQGRQHPLRRQGGTRAVKEVQAMSPPADFLIYGGDLAQLGDPVELDLGATSSKR